MRTLCVPLQPLEHASAALRDLQVAGLPLHAREAWRAASSALAEVLQAAESVPSHTTTRRGPVPPTDVFTATETAVYRPLVTIYEAARTLECSRGEVREQLADGRLPCYRLGHGIVRTRCAATPMLDISSDLVTADEAAAYLGVEKKWVYNHLGELPHCVLGMAKSFRLAELDWYVEEHRRGLR